MSSNQQKPQKMCKSPQKSLPHNQKSPKTPELGTYEILNTNCTLIGSNNLNLDSKVSYANIKVCKPIKSPENIIKKPQSPRNSEFLHNVMPQNIAKFQNYVQARTPKPQAGFNNGLGLGSPPVQYSNASPNYPNTVSPYNVQISSPANNAIKSPVPSPQNIRPPTPQPILPQAFQQLPTLSGQNLVQIIHAAPSNSNQTAFTNHPVLTQRTILAPQSSGQQLPTTPLLKIKPPQNILPKPPSSNNGGTQKSVPSNRGTINTPVAPQAAGVPNTGQQVQQVQQQMGQMGQIVLPGQAMQGPALLLNQVPLILGGNAHATGGVQLILRPGTPSASKLPSGGAGGLVLQPGGAILQQNQVQGHQLQQRNQQQPQQLVRVLTANGMLPLNSLNSLNSLPTYIMPQVQSQTSIQPQVQQVQSLPQTSSAKTQTNFMEQLPPPKKKPKKKKKNKEPKLDLANLMKLSGIGDEDDVMFESDASESAVVETTIKSDPTEFPKRIGNIHISALNTEITKNTKNSQISVQQSLSDINAINQNLTQIGLIGQQNYITGSNHILQQNPDNLANILQALNTNQNLHNFSSTFPTNQPVLQTSNYQKFPQNSTTTTFTTQKPSSFPNFPIQVQNFCNTNSNLILNQSTNLIAQNIPSFASMGGLIPMPGNLMGGFLPAGMVQSAQAAQHGQDSNFGANVQRNTTGGFKLALSEDGRLILQHDPTLNQDLQSQLLLQSIFGINLQGGNLVLTSVNNTPTPSLPPPPPPKQPTIPEPIKKPPPPQPLQPQVDQSTKTTNMIQNVIPSVQIKNEPQIPVQPPQMMQPSTNLGNLNPEPNPQTGNNPNYSYIVNLTPDQLEILKRNGQLTINGQTIFMHRPNIANKEDKNITKSPKSKTPKKPTKNNHTKTTSVQSVANQTIINSLQNPIGKEIYSKTIQNQKITENQMILQKQKPNGEQLIIQQQNESQTTEKQFFNGTEQNSLNVEQFLTNLNINPQNLSQIISQKLSNELQSEINPKILNISPGPNAGQILAKIDISSNEIENPPTSTVGNTDVNSMVLPPLVSMGVKPEINTFNKPGNGQLTNEVPHNIPPPQIQPQVQPQPTVIQPPVQQQLPTLILSNNVLGAGEMPPNLTGNAPAQDKVYQRVQTIQLTPQKQQLLKSVQLQITALSARLQQKTTDGSNPSDQTEIHGALRNLFLEQQKILATGKLIPNLTQPIASIANTSSTVETINTNTVPVSTATKSNGTFLTSLLQQPVVSHNSSPKVYYHHGNQIIAINPQITTSVSTPPSTTLSLSTSACQTVSVQPQQPQIKLVNKKPPIQNNAIQVTKPAINQQTDVQIANLGTQTACDGPKIVTSPVKRITKPTYSKAQLIEQQLQTDQNGAINPDINTPFSSKADAVKRLVRYHCYKQPVLSPKDLSKADEIFELTARHFIDKFRSMVNKYQSLLLKESMRKVQTSEMMMIDRMFLAEEQQSFIKLQSDIKLQNELEQLDAVSPPSTTSKSPEFEPSAIKTEAPESSEAGNSPEDTNTDFNIKCGLNYFSDGSCDSPNFNQNFDEVYDLNSDKNPKNIQKNSLEKVESYNTTKIIGNFEIEINNKINNSQESFSKKFNQKNENFSQTNDEYDELLCIHRELGYFPEKQDDHQKPESSDSRNSPDLKTKDRANKRTSSDRNCLESLKKYRVEKHNSKGKKSGSIIGEVKFEVRIEHKKVFPEQKQVKSETNDCAPQKPPTKRSQYETGDYTSKRAKCDYPSFIKQEEKNEFPKENETSDYRETFERQIDEQVQSAIDSILNLQQITSMTEKTDSQDNKLLKKNDDHEDLDEAVKSILS